MTEDPATRPYDVAGQATEHLDSLTDALRKLGLTVARGDANSLLISNPALDDSGSWARTLTRQEVVCGQREGGAGDLWWFWVWPAITSTAPPDLEPLCPAASTYTAAVAIARVLAVIPSR